jgi:hypothetical protein
MEFTLHVAAATVTEDVLLQTQPEEGESGSAVLGVVARRVGSLRPSSIHLDTPRLTTLTLPFLTSGSQDTLPLVSHKPNLLF